MPPAMIQLLVGSVLFGVWAYLVFDGKAPVEAFVGFISTVLAGLAGHLSARNGVPAPDTTKPIEEPKVALHGPQSGAMSLGLLLAVSLVVVMVVLLLSGCSSIDMGLFENRIACTPGKDKAFVISEYSRIGIASTISEKDLGVCK